MNEKFLLRIEILNWLIQSNETSKMFVLREFEKSKYLLPKIFFCFVQLQLFVVHKTFFEYRWADYKEDFLMLRQFF